MLKSTLVKLRKKPKVVREQIALFSAIGFTAVLFIFWLFTTVPSMFERASSSEESDGLFSDLKEEIQADAPDFGGMMEELQTVVASTSTTTAPEVVIPNEFPTSTAKQPPNERAIRIATTSSERPATTTSSEVG